MLMVLWQAGQEQVGTVVSTTQKEAAIRGEPGGLIRSSRHSPDHYGGTRVVTSSERKIEAYSDAARWVSVQAA
jgi:hypothetical protein